jgi:hypothetical protein
MSKLSAALLLAASTAFVSSLSAQVTFTDIKFSQNFNSGGIVSDYTSPANSADISRFTNIASTGSGSTAIVSNALVLSRSASSSGGFRFVRGTTSNTINGAPLSTALFQFDMNLTVSGYPGSALNTGMTFGIGESVTSGSYGSNSNNVDTTDSWAYVSVRLPSSGSTFQLRDASGNLGSALDLGTNYVFRIYANDTASTLNYVSPTGSSVTLSSGKFDVWVDNSLYFDELDSSNPSASINAFKLNHLSTSSSLALSATFDNILVASAIPEPSSFAALAGLTTLGLAATRRRRRAA